MGNENSNCKHYDHCLPPLFLWGCGPVAIHSLLSASFVSWTLRIWGTPCASGRMPSSHQQINCLGEDNICEILQVCGKWGSRVTYPRASLLNTTHCPFYLTGNAHSGVIVSSVISSRSLSKEARGIFWTLLQNVQNNFPRPQLYEMSCN